MPANSSSLSGQGQTVCVTGAGGFIASWIVKLLLEKGYSVKGTVRNPADPKNSHLMELEGAQERLTLCKAHLLDYESLKEAIQGCDGVFHTASPAIEDPEQMMEPAVTGTKNVMMAAAEAKVRRVVITSSIGAVYMDPNRSPDVVVDESCWSDLEYCKNTKNFYCYGKTVAEQGAWDLAKKKGVDLVVVNPVVVIGPLLQPTVNATTIHILKYLNGAVRTYANAVQGYVHVRDVALAHIVVFETPSAAGRYICSERVLHRGEVVEILAKFFPEYPIPTKCSDEKNPRKQPYKFTNQKIKNLADPKNSHLMELEGAQERLTLCKAHLLDYESLKEAIQGCDGVFHTASPAIEDPEKMMEPEVTGTRNVMTAAAEAKVRRVVLTSSTWTPTGALMLSLMNLAGVILSIARAPSQLNEMALQNLYCYGKTVAEQGAWDLAKKKGVDLVVVNPVVVLGPLLQPTVNATTIHILKYLNGAVKTYANAVQGYVHVRDVALAHIVVFETPSASGRYICSERMLHRGEVLEILAKFFPEYPIPTKCSDEKNPRKQPYKFTNQKIKDLGIEFIPVKQCLYETVKSLQENGHLPIPKLAEDSVKTH
ncbi:hypothetical protein DKX38_000312 [Salix brachista]|uniref:cinnamoyl-CoA reductase n=1 Tax=Salix brachista TaxID=2182728 RepID=A0A5N5P1Y0_9ROSI|nr:hypothetical protein DKX38_000312 [Salix brachista]